MKKITVSLILKTFLLFGTLLITSCAKETGTAKISTDGMTKIPMGGNAYVIDDAEGVSIEDTGICNWTNKNSVVSAWFKTSGKGTLDLAIEAKAAGTSKINVTVAGKTFEIELKSSEDEVIPVGSVNIAESGYVKVDFQGVSKSGKNFGEVSYLMVGGEAVDKLNFVPDDFEFYWARRGPSVHLAYTMPEEDVEYFYNEVTVPVGEDVIASYFMANGFSQGYFGMQVNSETTRKVLFSVWSPYDTEDPNDIPEEDRVKVLRSGKNVYIGEFGNEGSGGQSYLVYPWKAGNTYKFLTKIKPDGNNNTVYTSYFYAPEEGKWMLIASFLRPKTDTWYKGAHSFLENFDPQQGYITRKVLFDNQWVRTVSGEWKAINQATFTYDSTAKAQVRVDYDGGVDESGCFYLKNCGFFNENTTYKNKFVRNSKSVKPEIDLEALEAL